MKPPEPGRTAWLGIIAGWIVLSSIVFWNAPGDDLSSSYIAARLLAGHQPSRIYAHDPHRFHIVNDAAWAAEARRADFRGALHPYVQSPLWARLLAPVATRLSFPVFGRLFLVVELAAIGAVIVLAARLWNPSLLHPGRLAVLLIALSPSEPFRYAMVLLQTHSIVLALTLLAVFLAARNKPVVGGGILAIAAAMKLTPAIVAIYWLLTNRMRAAASFAATLGIAAVASVEINGMPLNREYWQTLQRVSQTGLVAFNNQSVPAWLLRAQVPLGDVFDWRILSIPRWIQVTSSMGLCLTLAGITWLILRDRGQAHDDRLVVPVLLTATIFAPIAWTHYFITLAPAAIGFTGLPVAAGGSAARWLLLAVMLSLNYRPVAMDSVHFAQTGNMFVWSHLLSAVLMIVAFSVLYAAGFRKSRFDSAEMRAGADRRFADRAPQAPTSHPE
jgi:hypothetical protein